MRRYIWTAAALLAALGMGVTGEFEPGVVAKAKPRSLGLRITMTDGIDDRIRSNGGQTYTNGIGGVVTNADGGGVFLQPGSRGLLHEFSVCADSPCDPPYLSGTGVTLVQIHPLTPDGTVAAPGGLLGMTLNVEHPAFVKILLSTRVDTAFWTLCSDPRTETPGICAASPRALGARIVRTSGSSWLVYASPSSGTSDEFDLIKEAGSGKRSTITVEGTFSMPFSMTVECLVASDCPVP